MAGGRFLLRMDDLDQARVKPDSGPGIVDDLAWLGLNHDGALITQTEREPLYAAAFGRLKKAGLVYPCRCSRNDIKQAIGRDLSPGEAPRYPGTCRASPLSDHDVRTLSVAWRFKTSATPITFHDEILGSQSATLSTMPGDFIVVRKDGPTAYQLASVVDDGLLGVTDVVRGADLADSTARQLALFDALGYQRPRFWHVPLMRDESGDKLSKRDGSQSLQQLRHLGVTPEMVVGQLAASVGLIIDTRELSANELLLEIGDLDALRQKLIVASNR